MDMLPAKVVGAAGRPISLPDWHNSDLKKQAPGLFSDARSMFLGIRSPSLGIVSQDQRRPSGEPTPHQLNSPAE
jgi:hypothetical protein